MLVPDWITSLADMTAVERQHYLESNADEVKDGIYYRDFTPEDLEQLRLSNAETDIEIRNLENEIKAVTEPLKARLTELRSAKKSTVTKLKEKREEVNGRTFVFNDFDTREAYEIDSNGNVINLKELTRRQKTIYQGIRREGTNG